MSSREVTRRGLLKYGLAAAAIGPWVLRHLRVAEAGPFATLTAAESASGRIRSRARSAIRITGRTRTSSVGI